MWLATAAISGSSYSSCHCEPLARLSRGREPAVEKAEGYAEALLVDARSPRHEKGQRLWNLRATRRTGPWRRGADTFHKTEDVTGRVEWHVEPEDGVDVELMRRTSVLAVEPKASLTEITVWALERRPAEGSLLTSNERVVRVRPFTWEGRPAGEE